MSSRVLLKEVNRISEGFPFIISGDFNMPPPVPVIQFLTGLMRVFHSLKMLM